MQISASQINTFEDCNRHWWFQKMMKLPVRPETHFTFGTILHGVCERWLSADKSGRVPGSEKDIIEADRDGRHYMLRDGPLAGQVIGEPVNIYPLNWEYERDWDGVLTYTKVTPTEQKHIKKLIAQAIEDGILFRTPGTKVEREFLLQVIEDVTIKGYIDVSREGDKNEIAQIEDHKTFSKGSIRFLKTAKFGSPNFLGSDQQVKTYAWAVTELDGLEGDSVAVTHNQYPKFPGRAPTRVTTALTSDEIQQHGGDLRMTAGEMLRASKVERWEDLDGPKDTGKCSRWYGKPCMFSDICGRTETPETYQKRMDLMIADQGSKVVLDLPLPKPRKRGKRDSKMGILDTGRQNTNAATAPTGELMDPPAGINGGTAPVATEPVLGGAPWANPECRACNGRGMTSQNKACPICDAVMRKQGQPNSMSYIVEVDDAGLGVAMARDDQVDVLNEAGMATEWVEADQTVDTPAEVATISAPVKHQVVLDNPAPVADKPKRKRRTKLEMAAAKAEAEAAIIAKAKVAAGSVEVPAEQVAAVVAAVQPVAIGLTILVGVVPLRGVVGGTINSSEVLARFGAELAEAMGADSYWALDSFKRRERLAERAEHIADELAGMSLIHPGVLGNDDTGSLVQALMGLDNDFIEAVYVRTA